MEEINYKEIARQARIKCLTLIFKAQTSHAGSNLSCIDILSVLFEKMDLNKDKFVLSAGWKAASLYYFLWRKGRITEEELNSFCQPGSKWIGLAEPVCKDVVIAGGSMGIGLPGAVGLALAKKLKGEDGKVYCLMSDGELQCGTFWESLLIASQHKLDNLMVIIDKNGFQAMGKTEDILKIPAASTLDKFGWYSTSCDGHNYEDINYVLDMDIENTPILITAYTVKGKGVSFMENNNLYHYKQLSELEYMRALEELGNCYFDGCDKRPLVVWPNDKFHYCRVHGDNIRKEKHKELNG